jgi:glyoxylase-like metal-dependent hydrolase (beta-lactamase superfamily II)
MKRTLVLGAIVAVGALSMVTSAFQGPPAGGRQGGPNVAQIEKVKDNLYMITGGGGNTAAFITDGGVVIVDTKLANWGQAILDKVRTVSDKPVSLIINTHTHPDHTGSNEFFGRRWTSSHRRTRRPTCRTWTPSKARALASCRSGPSRTP